MQKQKPRDYTTIKETQQSGVTWGAGNNQLQAPKTIALDERTGNIYIADSGNNRIQIFDRELTHCFKLHGCESPYNKDMRYPWGVCIRNSLLFVTEKLGNILKIFELDGTFITSTVTTGTGCIVKFSSPLGVAVDEENTAYVCDEGSKSIIVLISGMPSMTKMQIESNPMDVKLHKECVLVLLEAEGIKVAFYSKNGDFVRNVKVDALNTPCFLATDRFDNLLIACQDTPGKQKVNIGSIVIHSWEGELIHKIHSLFKNVRGLAVDREGRIINTCESMRSRIMIL